MTDSSELPNLQKEKKLNLQINLLNTICFFQLSRLSICSIFRIHFPILSAHFHFTDLQGEPIGKQTTDGCISWKASGLLRALARNPWKPSARGGLPFSIDSAVQKHGVAN